MSTHAKPEKSIAELAAADTGAFSHIVNHVNLLRMLNQQVQIMLPPLLQGHCEVADWKNNQLSLQVENSAWAARLRYEQIELVKQLRQTIPELASLKQLRIFVA